MFLSNARGYSAPESTDLFARPPFGPQPLPHTTDTSTRLTRRRLLKVCVAGAAALLLARWFRTATFPPRTTDASFSVLDASARSIVAAIVPVLLEGALPTGNDAITARADVLAGVDRTVAGLLPAVRDELDQLFGLLAFTPTRCLIAGVWSPWQDASHESVAAFLDNWRHSRFALPRAGYRALHEIILGAWYGNPRAWTRIGYAGPPSVDIG